MHHATQLGKKPARYRGPFLGIVRNSVHNTLLSYCQYRITASARLKTLFMVRLVKRRREAKHVFYSLADEDLPPMLRNTIEHAAEDRTAVSADPRHRKEITP